MRNSAHDLYAIKSDPTGGVPAPEMRVPPVPVPVAQIRDARETFGARGLSFEVLLEAPDPADGFAFCAEIARAGLSVKRVTYQEGGSFFLKLADDGAGDLAGLEGCFSGGRNVSILRWTNIISTGNTMPSRACGAPDPSR